MSTSTLSVRLDEELKEQGSKIIRSKGASPASVVTAVWKEIITTGKVPGIDTPATTPAEEVTPFNRIMELRAQMPTGTPLSSMDASDLRAELANRD